MPSSICEILVVDEMASVVNWSKNSDVWLSNAIGNVVSGNRAVDENAVVDSVDIGGDDAVHAVDALGVVVRVGSCDVVTIGLNGVLAEATTVGPFDVVVVVVIVAGLVGAADVDDGLLGIAVDGLFVGVVVLGLSSSTVVYVTFTLELGVGV